MEQAALKESSTAFELGSSVWLDKGIFQWSVFVHGQFLSS